MFSFFYSIYYWQRLRYHVSFAIVFGCNISVAAGLLLAFALVLKLIRLAINKFCKPKETLKEEEEEEALVTKQSLEREDPSAANKAAKWGCSKVFNFIGHILNFLALLLVILAILALSIIPSAFYGMHLLPLWTTILSILIFYAFWISLIAILLSLKKKEKVEDANDNSSNPQTSKTKIKLVFTRHKLAFSIATLGALVLSIGIPLAMRDSCLCVYSENYGISFMNGTAVFSTRLIRSFTLKKACDIGAPCHVYATLPANTSTAVFINAHTHYDVDTVIVNYDTLDFYEQNGYTRYNSTSSSYKLNFESNGRRTVHSTLLYGLEPETEYYYEIYYDGQPQYSSVYMTLPGPGTHSPLTIAIGGDVGASDIGGRVTSSLSETAPKLMIIGGDAAYDDGIQACWYSWDLYLNGFEEYNQKVNRTIPFIVSVGNHDVGFNAMSEAELDKEELPLYFIYLPQHFKINATTGESIMAVPDFLERESHFYHVIGNTIHFSLDSGYVDTYEDQAVWMENILPQFNNSVKFGNYHVPIYPACDNVLETPIEHIQAASDYFVPMFEKYKFKALFENHVHVFKKTFPLKQGKIDPEGIVYFGDGNWGITPNECIEQGLLVNNTGVHEAASSQRHIWILNINTTGYEIFPINENGTKFYSSTTGQIAAF